MKIEAKDQKHPTMIRVATITDVNLGEVKVHFDGRGCEYDYWCPSSSTDIHPPMWRAKTLKMQAEKPDGKLTGFSIIGGCILCVCRVCVCVCRVCVCVGSLS